VGRVNNRFEGIILGHKSFYSGKVTTFGKCSHLIIPVHYIGYDNISWRRPYDPQSQTLGDPQLPRIDA